MRNRITQGLVALLVVATAGVAQTAEKPPSVQSLLQRAFYKEVGLRDLEGAKKDYRRVLSSFPDTDKGEHTQNARVGLVRVLVAQGDVTRAREVLTGLLEVAPQNAEGLALQAKLADQGSDIELQLRIRKLINDLDGEGAKQAREELEVLFERARGQLADALRDQRMNVVRSATMILAKKGAYPELLSALRDGEVLFREQVERSLSIRGEIDAEKLEFLQDVLRVGGKAAGARVINIIRLGDSAGFFAKLPAARMNRFLDLCIASQNGDVLLTVLELVRRLEHGRTAEVFRAWLATEPRDHELANWGQAFQRDAIWAQVQGDWHEAMIDRLSGSPALQQRLVTLSNVRPAPAARFAPRVKQAVRLAIRERRNTATSGSVTVQYGSGSGSTRPPGINLGNLEALACGTGWSFAELLTLWLENVRDADDLLYEALEQADESARAKYPMQGYVAMPDDYHRAEWIKLLDNSGIRPLEIAWRAASSETPNLRWMGYHLLTLQPAGSFAGREGLPRWEEDLSRSRNPQSLVEVLASWGSPAVVPALTERCLRYVKDRKSQPAVRMMRSIARIEGPEALAALEKILIGLLEAGENRAHEARTALLQRLGEEKGVDRLIAIGLELPSSSMRQSLLSGWSGGDAAWARMLDAFPLDYADPGRLLSEKAWRELPKKERQPLLDLALASRSPNSRRAAIAVVRGLPREEATPLLLPLVQDPSEKVAAAARSVIEGWRLAAEVASIEEVQKRKEATERAKTLLRSPDARVREAAVHALVVLASPEAVGLLLDRLGDESPKVREAAFLGLRTLAQ